MSDAPERLWKTNERPDLLPAVIDLTEERNALREENARLEARIAKLEKALGRMQCTCLPHAKPHDGMCDRCMALEANDAS